MMNHSMVPGLSTWPHNWEGYLPLSQPPVDKLGSEREGRRGGGDEGEGGEGWADCIGGKRILAEPYLRFWVDSNGPA